MKDGLTMEIIDRADIPARLSRRLITRSAPLLRKVLPEAHS